MKDKVSVAAVRYIKSGTVIVECNSRRDAEKLKTVVEALKKLKGRELEMANPRFMLGRIDKELTPERLIKVLVRKNGDLVEACEGGVKSFENQFKERFRKRRRDS
ncbi:hypothetical protein ILUMI_13853 [Ignelater luminosus]|uniref:Uncharacterized protein n=1 Tax=Ignelater luminosus TaxID=2038154 RepID=A0A8K0CVY1_IGNLU|nr:hypothetical protein ILUMI_13853 [Ignelater luminosus]